EKISAFTIRPSEEPNLVPMAFVARRTSSPPWRVIRARPPGRPVAAPAILGGRVPPLCEYRLPQKCPAALWADLKSSESRARADPKNPLNRAHSDQTRYFGGSRCQAPPTIGGLANSGA